MNKIAFIYGETLIYWSSIVMALAVVTGTVFFWAAYIRKSDDITGAAAACPLAIVLSLLLARLVYWYFRTDSYESLNTAMTDFTSTGYALTGAFAGCLLTAGILRLLKKTRNFPLMLDCMSIGGCAAIAIGRLSCFFTSDSRGEILPNGTQLPLAYPVINTTSGLPEYRFATFLFQAGIAGCIFLVLLILFWTGIRKQRYQNGDIALLFLLFYCASQIVLDSTRYDSLRLRSNGFISIVQILCALTLALVIVIFSIRLRKRTGGRIWHFAIWLTLVLGMSGAGYMEYYVQRHGNQALFAYAVMGGCLGMIVMLGVILWRKGILAQKRKGLYAKA